MKYRHSLASSKLSYEKGCASPEQDTASKPRCLVQALKFLVLEVFKESCIIDRYIHRYQFLQTTRLLQQSVLIAFIATLAKVVLVFVFLFPE